MCSRLSSINWPKINYMSSTTKPCLNKWICLKGKFKSGWGIEKFTVFQMLRLGLKVQENNNHFQESLQSWRSFARPGGGACTTPASPCTGSGASGTSPGPRTFSTAGNPWLHSFSHSRPQSFDCDNCRDLSRDTWPLRAPGMIMSQDIWNPDPGK